MELAPGDQRGVVALRAEASTEVFQVVESLQQEPRTEAILFTDELTGVGWTAPNEDTTIVLGPHGDDAGRGIPPPKPFVLSRWFGDDSRVVLGHLARDARGLRAGNLRFAGFEDFDGEGECTALARLQRANAHDLT